MAPNPNATHLLLILLSLSLLAAAAESGSDLVGELRSLESESKDGVIHLNDDMVSRFVTSAKAPRPYSLLIFFDAKKLHDKPELRLQDLRGEFAVLASSFIANNPAAEDRGRLFFCDLEFQESQPSFALFGVNSLPHIRLVGQDARSPKDSDQMDQGDFSRLAESMADFVNSKTGLDVGPIHRPPMLSKNQLALIALALLIWAPFFVRKLVRGNTVFHDAKIWLAGAVFVYFFSVSGSMHNIIRKMPMFLADRNDPSRLVFFYQGSGMQLGAEGFAIGFLYTVVGLMMALVTHALVRVRNVNVQRAVMVLAMLVSFWAVRKVVYLDNWKTGYGVHAFWPSSWR